MRRTGRGPPAAPRPRPLSRCDGPIPSLITGLPDTGHARAERHVCIDTTASGGTAALPGGNM
ncbi:hypothetical protein [Salipiger sp.]|uniref:hypothetical protein n=1 Tax=Salipiger sp. TaxID=2078585 RepID=UPI003A976A58